MPWIALLGICFASMLRQCPFQELRQAREGVCLRDGLVLLYYVTPSRGSLRPQWDKYLEQYDVLQPRMRACLEVACAACTATR